MNDWQTARQMKSRIRAHTWPDGGTEKVIGSDCVITSMEPEEVVGSLSDPIVLIRIGEATPETTRGDLWRQQFGLEIVTREPNDEFGESSHIGGPRTGGQGSSEGRGVLEIQEEVLKSLGFENAAVGLPRFTLIGARAASPLFINRSEFVRRLVTVEATCTTERTYPAPKQLVANGGSGQVALTWALPPDRYDRYQIILRRASGATAPESATGGTSVPLSSDLATSVTDSGLGSGTYSYAIFCAYDETNTYDGGTASSADRYSSEETGTTRLSVSVT